MIDRHPDSRHSRARQALETFFARGGHVSCPLDSANTDLVYQTELTARFRCRRVRSHSFSLPISLFKPAEGTDE